MSFAIFSRAIPPPGKMGVLVPPLCRLFAGGRGGVVFPARAIFVFHHFLLFYMFFLGGEAVVFPGGATTGQDHQRRGRGSSIVNIGPRGRDRTRQDEAGQGKTRQEEARVPQYGISRPDVPVISKKTLSNFAISPHLSGNTSEIRP